MSTAQHRTDPPAQAMRIIIPPLTSNYLNRSHRIFFCLMSKHWARNTITNSSDRSYICLEVRVNLNNSSVRSFDSNFLQSKSICIRTTSN